MSVAKVIEITASSETGFDDAVREGIAVAAKTVDRIRGAWIQEQKVVVSKGKVTEFRVNMKISFEVEAD